MPTHTEIAPGDHAQWSQNDALVEVLAIDGNKATVRDVETGAEFTAAVYRLSWVPSPGYELPPKTLPKNGPHIAPPGNPHTHVVDRHWRGGPIGNT